MFSLKSEIVFLHDNTELLGHSLDLLHLTVHGGFAELNNWGHDELDEASLKGSLIIGFIVVLPLLGFGIKEIVTPKLLHHLVLWNTELLGVSGGEDSDGEGPSEKS